MQAIAIHTPIGPLPAPINGLLGQRHSAGRSHQKELVRNAIQVMNANTQRIKFSALSFSILFIAAEILLSLISLGAKSPKSALCAASQYREFYFWIGDWDAFDFGTSTKDARVQLPRPAQTWLPNRNRSHRCGPCVTFYPQEN